MRVTVSTRVGVVAVDDLDANCSSDELKRRVLDVSGVQLEVSPRNSDHCLVRNVPRGVRSVLAKNNMNH